MSNSSLTFSITGEFLTNHYRDLVKEGSWRVAAENLKASLFQEIDEETNRMSTDTVFDILSGKKRLEGENQVFIEDEEPGVEEELFQKFVDSNYRLSKTIKYESNYYMLALILDTALEDCDKTLLRDRVHLYLKGKEYISLYNSEGTLCVFSRISCDIPFWYENKFSTENIDYLTIDNNEDNLASNSDFSDLLRDDEIDSYEYEIEVESRGIKRKKDATLHYRKLIIAQAEKKYGFVNITVDGEDFSIPKAPFYNWYNSKPFAPKDHTYEWEEICPVGFKMRNDNPTHSDWMIGAGIDSKRFYKDSEYSGKFYSMAFK